ncbi:MAG: prolipoprotein diacylglyceryl transferase [Amylibacter sp.]|nr:prolipoprotein diacylglyceryl transferase [Amylibacter sp.]
MIYTYLIPFPQIDPILFSFEVFGFTLAIRWYALAYIAAFLLATWWINRLIKNTNLWKNGTPPLTKLQVEDMLTWMIIGTILGGRFGYVVFYNLDFFLQNPGNIMRVWEGGLSFHGGFLGVITAGLIFCWKNKLNPWAVGDTLAASVTIGLFLGRLANFINAELWGRPTDVPWAMEFPGADCPIWWLSDTCGRHPSQLYEAALEGIVLFAIITFLIFRRGWLKIPGQIIGVFFIGYGIARTIVEGFRQGDAQFTGPTNPWGHVIRFGQDIDSLGLSMGQILSIPMIVVGLAILLFVRWRA